MFLAFVLLPILNAELGIFTAEVNVQLEKLREFTVSPDGKYAAYTTRKLSLETGEYTHSLYLHNIFDAKQEKLELDCFPINNLQWTPSNKIISFLATIENKCTFCLYNIEKKSYTKAMTFPVDVGSYKWGSKGTLLAFSAYVYLGETMQKTAEIDAKVYPYNKMVFDELFVYHWGDWESTKWNHLFSQTIKVDPNSDYVYTFDGEPVDIMSDKNGHCPSEPFGGNEEYDISQDCKWIAYTTQTGKDQAWTLKKKVYLFDLTTKKEKLISTGDAMNTCPVFEPEEDWKFIIYKGTKKENCESDQQQIIKYSRDGDNRNVLNNDFEYSVDSIQWSVHKKDVIMASSRIRGTSDVVFFDANTGEQISSMNMRCCEGFFVLPTEEILFRKSLFHKDPQLYIMKIAEAGQKEATQLTFFNEEVFQKLYPLIPCQELWYEGANNDQIHGFFIPPLHSTVYNAEPSAQKWPLIMYIHGGPENGWTDDWSDRWNPQTLVHQGYAIFAPNFHGSDSYGQEFTDSIIGRWGSWPHEDINKGKAFILKEKAYLLDPDRVAAMGASYGGYMMNWLQTHNTDYKAIICHDGLFDLPSFYHETDELYFFESEHLGAPWEKGYKDKHYNPAEEVNTGGAFKTPMLVIHGGVDFRVPLSQGISLFHVLQGKGVPSRLVYFPSENHWVLRPQNSVRWHKECIAWLKHYV
ncbi:putative Alanyl dipeptidyl peptidase [Monocercomonoides exilis]|uniref:putative Alanyl dipeptidyl peptidase n=1 Tax=Monocercomonoides exilis TaxID=2049356 RepID=UPI00355A73F9|nr:putative Alanyl dipeptidyl peptidase [Monocercomonoides exilis]|eukprot:MONOS_9848.1-p1 / transcript=MONOS_9848.1 / gene=MONOS_9848 / organism=Monocercomonoides_exilis_PA203 / gene_product=Alanyl dipeptidyl peptidase / transcript_product=Alanyl dipeptidyl peptidase / location=Mono_scaffold00422:25460-27662(+) / protein_length=691 / sequence_SO=supercontig / SO=protein_coding / is_pseudo=false